MPPPSVSIAPVPILTSPCGLDARVRQNLRQVEPHQDVG